MSNVLLRIWKEMFLGNFWQAYVVLEHFYQEKKSAI